MDVKPDAFKTRGKFTLEDNGKEIGRNDMSL
jgi:hypothetical protein